MHRLVIEHSGHVGRESVLIDSDRESGGIDDAVNFKFATIRYDCGFRNPLYALGVGNIDQMNVFAIECS